MHTIPPVQVDEYENLNIQVQRNCFYFLQMTGTYMTAKPVLIYTFISQVDVAAQPEHEFIDMVGEDLNVQVSMI